MASGIRLRPAGRGRGRPIGSDSAETRARILRAAREIINERGYRAASFQAIADRADLSRPTMHYYFGSREEIYHSLVQEAQSIIAECIEQSRREDSLLKQLSAFMCAAYRLNFEDRAMMRFIITTRLEYHRLPSLRTGVNQTVGTVGEYFRAMVEAAIERREIPADIDAAAVANMLLAMSWGMGFYTGFVDDDDDVLAIAKQLHTLFLDGLLKRPPSDRSLTIDPHAPATIAIEAFAGTWPGLTLAIDTPEGQPYISAGGAQPVVVGGHFTRERVRSLLYCAYQVESSVDGLGRYDTLDDAALPSA